MGADEQKRWKQEGDGVQDFIDKYQSDKEFADEVDHAMGQALGKMYTNNQDGWLKAFIGDTTRKVEEGRRGRFATKGGVLGQ
ncbi:hypothetical protein [Duganella sacchari]|uniref:hypothetical protein n=1 Tax=Duganella sacchari TaxID=551987 RepID=UPI001114D09B|nr:hypothetical protein [Duganella sacchari]